MHPNNPDNQNNLTYCNNAYNSNIFSYHNKPNVSNDPSNANNLYHNTSKRHS